MCFAVLEFRPRIRPDPLVVDAPGDNEITRVFDLCNALDRCMQVLGGVVSTDVGELVCPFDRVVSSAGLSEAVCGGAWKPFYQMMLGGSK